MYRYEIVADARAQLDGLPTGALVYYAELISFLELTPWEGPPYRGDNPDSGMRRMIFGHHGLAVYVILEQDRRVVVVSVTWVG